MFNSLIDKLVFFYFSILLCVIGSLHMFKKYEPEDRHGMWLGAFWLFLGVVFLVVYFKVIA